MIDLNAIEAAAKAATPGPWEAAGPSFGEQLPKYLNCVGAMDDDENFVDVCVSPFEEDECASADMAFIATANPATVLEMVSTIRQQHSDVVELRSQLMMLETQVTDLRTEAIERDKVLKQALAALERTEMYLRIEVNDSYGRDAHVSTITEWQEKLAHHKGAIAAIKGVLGP